MSVDRVSVYMTMAYLVSMLSKDLRTRIGAVIVGPDNEVRSTGYNGFPRGCDDDNEERQEKPEKYFWFEHAERNAIYNAARMGLSTKGCVMYTMGIPCADCARGVIQAGIVKVVIHNQWDLANEPKWKESGYRSEQMFREAGVFLERWSGEIVLPEARRGGETKSLFDISAPSVMGPVEQLSPATEECFLLLEQEEFEKWIKEAYPDSSLTWLCQPDQPEQFDRYLNDETNIMYDAFKTGFTIGFKDIGVDVSRVLELFSEWEEKYYPVIKTLYEYARTNKMYEAFLTGVRSGKLQGS